MKYETVEKKKYDAEVEEKLIELWHKTKSYEEFIVVAELNFPYAPKMLMLAFKVHYFKMMHPTLYFLLHIAMFAICVCSVFSVCAMLLQGSFCNCS